eukprot:9805487-Lingulodinium_polyedra.AAC.1
MSCRPSAARTSGLRQVPQERHGAGRRCGGPRRPRRGAHAGAGRHCERLHAGRGRARHASSDALQHHGGAGQGRWL